MIKLTQQFPTNPDMQLWQTRDLQDAPVVQELLHRFPHDILHVQNTRMGIPVVWIKREILLNAIRYLRHAPKPFVMLYDLHATDERLRTHRHGLPASEFTMFYHFLSIERNSDVILKIPLMEADLKMPSIIDEFPNANWYEREVWDMFGVHFDGHPHLTRILMPKNWKGHPLRKEYPARATEFEPFMLDEMRQDEAQEQLLFKPEEWGMKRGTSSEDYMFLNLGPNHPSAHGAFR
ncbi:MAG: NADH-quinone oxidoreductase subunit C, partial [Tolumonas sp.]|nr:NADH-quinone oxidoreductase subunit C [Tolumonas sp.]